ncbi:MAG: acetolactate decarboxylase, partial [Gloeobacteraceae cyanobacterium ES-bin-316]|nr:acetolactate decarboxylase [Ferruginibacter sp.]
KGDLSAYLNLDTLIKRNLFALGPVAGLKGEILVLDGKVYSSSWNGRQLQNKQNEVSQAAMLVYSYVQNWKAINLKIKISSYAELEKLVETTAIANGYDIEIPFAFKIETGSLKALYHVINWQEGTKHTMENHKKFSYEGQLKNNESILLGFYSQQHQSIFTHHTSNMHIHVLDKKTTTVGHLDSLFINGSITIYLPVK